MAGESVCVAGGRACMAGTMCGMGGVCGGGACMAGGMHGRGMCGRGCAWQGGMHGRGCAWTACMAGGVCGGGFAWQEKTAIGAGDTHTTGMHSCYSKLCFSDLLDSPNLLNSLNSCWQGFYCWC